MILRNGIFTLYEGIEMSVYNPYGHGLTIDEINNYRIISYRKNDVELDGFILNNDSIIYSKKISVDKIFNMYEIVSKAKYLNISFLAESNTNEKYIKLKTNNISFLIQNGLSEYKIGDEKKMSLKELYENKYFVIDGIIYFSVNINSIQSLWEERIPYLDFPFPEGLPTREELEIPS